MDTTLRTRLDDHITDLTFQQIMDLVRHDDAVFHYADNLDPADGDYNPMGALAGRVTTALTTRPDLDAHSYDAHLGRHLHNRARHLLHERHHTTGWTPAGHDDPETLIDRVIDRTVSELNQVVEALALRDVITGEDYDLLTCTWRAAVGPLYEGEPVIIEPVTQVWAPHVRRLAEETRP